MTNRNPMSTTWITTALTDAALLHSTLGASSGFLYHTNLTATPSVSFSVFLSRKIEVIRLVNERMADISKALRDGTLGAIALLRLMETTAR